MRRLWQRRLDAQTETASAAARLCKADLVSSMVYEFPELQGVMGGYYADDAAVGAAIRGHYSPLGPGDDVPATAEGALWLWQTKSTR